MSSDDDRDRQAQYDDALGCVASLLEGETDWVTAMATVVCELHHAFDHYDWTGFYRVIGPELLAVGPYQGAHGCLRIPFERGVCGAAARTKATQVVPDVREFPGHIACSATTLSEIVVPVITPQGRVIAVLDVDSNRLDAFTGVDRTALESMCGRLGRQFGFVDSP